ncbi:hypothetical protein V5O48_011792 [Marasmius crinis-equi]|uniref:Uncharacterized protein n=1 Tax=Marasmius crinis-equi TaxID=585013 RepID=A0ABR3F4L1_9AGAR
MTHARNSSPIPELAANQSKPTGSSEPSAYPHKVAIHLAHSCLPSIARFQLPSNTLRCRRFIQFARSRSRNKDYLEALQTVERLLALTEVALRNFYKSSGSGDPDEYPISEQPTRSGELADEIWDDNDASSTSSDSWPTSTSTSASYQGDTDAFSISDSEPSTPYLAPLTGDWKWIADLIVLFSEALDSGRCDMIVNPQRNSWSKFMEARHGDWLAGDDASLALDHRDSFDQELRCSSFDFTRYVEELLMPGRRYGMLLQVVESQRLML